ncbi:hypothetical protein M0802_015132 [Mischocyttarus mexicanus]|nr:hypothetical protein M0802_015132 [Mischocyttarus mexicanus]
MQEAEHIIRNIDCDDPFELYKLFLNDNILQLIIEETNKYSIQCGFSANRRKHQLSWKPVTVNELKAFFAILLIMGIVQMPDIRLYWMENNIDNTTCSTEDPLNKINKIVAKIITTFKNVVKPGKTVVIDETMIPWRGSLRFRQYLKGKQHKYGIKVYKLCLPNGYTYDLDIYAGKRMNSSTYGHGYDVVLKLMNGLLFEQRVLYTDSFYSSIPLAQSLLQKGTYFCGTIQLNRKFLPLNKNKKQKRGEIRSSENSSGIKFVQWTDKRTVSMNTSCPNHNCEFTRERSTRYKLDLVIDYNDAKKGVDLSNQMSAYYSSLRKTIKWYKKIVIQLICDQKGRTLLVFVLGH